MILEARKTEEIETRQVPTVFVCFGLINEELFRDFVVFFV